MMIANHNLWLPMNRCKYLVVFFFRKKDKVLLSCVTHELVLILLLQ